MTFCIECGAKAPDVAKFCPQCGVSLVAIDTVKAAAVDVETSTAKTAEKPKTVSDSSMETSSSSETETPKAVETTPLAAASLKAAANSVDEAPKSKAGLFVGLGLVALLAAGGGAYALGLFDGVQGEKRVENVPNTSTATPSTQTKKIKTTPPDTKPVLTAYKEAIKTGRISDLGKFAQNHPKHSLAKDAEDAAFASLNRQKSTLAYNTFIKYFPDADLSAYSGLREDNVGDSLSTSDLNTNASSVIPPESEPAPIVITPPAIRTSISQRAEELQPFIAQGDIDYALLVLDEMLAQTDLNESEATYLLNLRASTETSRALIAPAPQASVEPQPVQVELIQIDTPEPAPETAAQPAVTQPETIKSEGFVPAVEEPVIIKPAAAIDASATPDADVDNLAPMAEITKIEPETDMPAPVETVTPEPAPLFDTAAKPIERFGAITPDEATEPGSCDMAFSVDTSGSPTNIVASCTDPLFIAPAKETVAEWTYSPAQLAGEPVQQDGIIVKIRFNLE